MNEEADDENIVEKHRCDQRPAILAAQPAGDADGQQRCATDARDFWPLYREYTVELSKWYDRRLALIKSYLENGKMMTDEQTRKLADDVFSLEEKRIDLKRKYFKKFSRVAGVKKTARFFQIENRLNAAIDLRLAAALPLIK